MFDFLSGTVKEVRERSVVLANAGVGYLLHVPNSHELVVGSTATLFVYFHWNQENGPSLYGFTRELERRVFLLIIDCPKIGPGIGLSILSGMKAGQFLDAITTQNDQALSAINGIGEKKAEQIIVHLKHKVSKLLSSGELVVEHQESFVQWQSVADVLTSLNYSKQEVGKAMQHLTEKYASQNCPIDQLIRSALAYLSAKQI